jgi:hypothetical protein
MHQPILDNYNRLEYWELGKKKKLHKMLPNKYKTIITEHKTARQTHHLCETHLT